MREDLQIDGNIRAHDRISGEYEALHGEIFNPIEQRRLRAALSTAMAEIQTQGPKKVALDFGCGSGNLTSHLIDLGFSATAADVSGHFLRLVEKRYGGAGLATAPLNGRDLSNLADDSFDFVATYSVLHHVPDYLCIVGELARVTKAGGVLFIDHEHCASYWSKTPRYLEFREAAAPPSPKSWGRFLKLSNYLFKFNRMIDPRYEPEGDIHVWPDDHIEWDKIEAVLAAHGFTTIVSEDYLLYRRGFYQDVYEKYKDQVSDMRIFAARKALPEMS